MFHHKTARCAGQLSRTSDGPLSESQHLKYQSLVVDDLPSNLELSARDPVQQSVELALNSRLRPALERLVHRGKSSCMVTHWFVTLPCFRIIESIVGGPGPTQLVMKR